MLTGDGLSRAVRTGRIAPARAALLRAEALFHPRLAADQAGVTISSAKGDATMILRDLALRQGDLSPADRVRAQRILARPSDGAGDPIGYGWSTPEAAKSPWCDAQVCVHWTTGSADAPAAADVNANGVPDWVETTLATVSHVRSVELGMGYRGPKSDQTSSDNGGDGRLDVYLAQLGADGLMGYTVSDDPNLPAGSPYAYYDMSTYMVLDNDFSAADYGTGATPLQNLQAAAAHEFFHSIQAAYDWFEDTWIMEGTAMWAEGVVSPDLHSAVPYLNLSALRAPGVSLDSFAQAGYFWYGSWLWFQFLTERVGGLDGLDTDLIRRLWMRMDGSPGGADNYSLEALRAQAVADGFPSLAYLYADFAMWNRDKLLYHDGALYPPAVAVQRFTLGPSHRSTGWLTLHLNHLANAPAQLIPGSAQPRSGHVTIRFDLPDLVAGSGARVLVRTSAGSVVLHRVALDADGNGSVRVEFGHGLTGNVTLIAVNGSSRYAHCFTGSSWSCSGYPVDQGLAYKVSATLS